jgi:hypothetical protein
VKEVERGNPMKRILPNVIILLSTGILVYCSFVGKTSLTRKDGVILFLIGAVFGGGLYEIAVKLDSKKTTTSDPVMIQRNKAIVMVIIVVILGTYLAFKIFR